MKKAITIVFICLAIGGGFGWYYYDRNIRYGAPINTREVSKNEGYHFDGAIGERQLAFWNYNGNFQANLGRFSGEGEALKSFESQINTYQGLVDLNGGNLTRKEITGHPAFIVQLMDLSYLFEVQVKDKVLQVTNSDRSEEEIEKFVKWFIKYWI